MSIYTALCQLFNTFKMSKISMTLPKKSSFSESDTEEQMDETQKSGHLYGALAARPRDPWCDQIPLIQTQKYLILNSAKCSKILNTMLMQAADVPVHYITVIRRAHVSQRGWISLKHTMHD